MQGEHHHSITPSEQEKNRSHTLDSENLWGKKSDGEAASDKSINKQKSECISRTPFAKMEFEMVLID